MYCDQNYYHFIYKSPIKPNCPEIGTKDKDRIKEEGGTSIQKFSSKMPASKLIYDINNYQESQTVIS